MNERQFPFDVFPTVADALRALQNEQIDAVVYDAPMLRYGVRQEFSTDLRVLPGDFERQYYGVALPAGSALREPVNRALLNHIETPAWQRAVAGIPWHLRRPREAQAPPTLTRVSARP